MRLLMIALTFFAQEKAVQQDTLLVGIQSKPDSTKAALYIAAGEKSFSAPKVADSLGLLAFETAKRAGKPNSQGRGAFIICYANLEVNTARSKQWADTAVKVFRKSEQSNLGGLCNPCDGCALQPFKQDRRVSLIIISDRQRSLFRRKTA